MVCLAVLSSGRCVAAVDVSAESWVSVCCLALIPVLKRRWVSFEIVAFVFVVGVTNDGT